MRRFLGGKLNGGSSAAGEASAAESSTTVIAARKTFPTGLKLLHDSEDSVVEYVRLSLSLDDLHGPPYCNSPSHHCTYTTFISQVLANASRTLSTTDHTRLCSLVSCSSMGLRAIARRRGRQKTVASRGRRPFFLCELPMLASLPSDMTHTWQTGKGWFLRIRLATMP